MKSRIANSTIHRAILVATLLTLFPHAGFAQSVSFGGFVKFDGIFDTRQVVAAREGHFLLYPKPVERNSDGLDMNANANLLMAMFQTRLFARISAPEVWGAKVSGLVEGDFFGASNETVSTFRLRNAYIKMDWPDRELLIGQFWSPLFTTEAYPQTVSFNTGMPFQPFARHPQVRFTWKPGKVRVMGAFDQQRDAFEEVGLGRQAQQLAVRPGAHLHVKYAKDQLSAGIGLHGRTVRPEPRGEQTLSGALTGYAAYLSKDVSVRAKAVLGSDMGDHLMLGGIAEWTESDGEIVREDTRMTSFWMDVESTTNPSAGLFAGYSKNLGLEDAIPDGSTLNMTWIRGVDIESLWRISPRVVLREGNLRFALEFEVSGASYGTDLDTRLRPILENGDNLVVNYRTLLAAYLTF